MVRKLRPFSHSSLPKIWSRLKYLLEFMNSIEKKNQEKTWLETFHTFWLFNYFLGSSIYLLLRETWVLLPFRTSRTLLHYSVSLQKSVWRALWTHNDVLLLNTTHLATHISFLRLTHRQERHLFRYQLPAFSPKTPKQLYLFGSGLMSNPGVEIIDIQVMNLWHSTSAKSDAKVIFARIFEISKTWPPDKHFIMFALKILGRSISKHYYLIDHLISKSS